MTDTIEKAPQYDLFDRKFNNWLSKKNNPYAFTCEKIQNESVYVDGRGFIENSPENSEKKCLANIFNVIGISALIWTAFDDLISKILIMLMDFLGLDIHTSFSNSIVYGSCHAVAGTLIIMGSLKILLPLLFIHSKFRIRPSAAIMHNMRNPSALIGAISMAFLMCTATSIPSAYSSEAKEIVAFFASNGADVSVWNQSEFIIYTIFDVLIMPIATQFLFCGAMFAVMRQFGDSFAIIMSSITAALLTQDLQVIPAVFLITLVGAYGMTASGTIFTAIAVNILYKMYALTLNIIELNSSDNMPMIRNIFMIAVLATGSAGLLFYRSSLKKHSIPLRSYSSSITFGKRIINSAKTFPYSAVAILCVIYALMKVVL